MAGTMVLVNPAAGGGRAGTRWASLASLARTWAPFEVVLPVDSETARREVAAALNGGARRIVVWGGDGTIHLVVNEVLRQGGGEEIIVGLVPAGTGCDLVRSLPIPPAREEALRQALLGPPVRLDAGRCEAGGGSFRFVNIASAGISGLIDEKVNAIADRGPLSYLWTTLLAFRDYVPARAEVRVDGTPVFVGEFVIAAVANGTTFGKGMRIAPQAEPDDGLLDVVVVESVGRVKLALRMPQLYLGKHLGARPVTVARGRTVELLPEGPLPPFDADGETYPGGRAVFTVHAGAWLLAGPNPAEERSEPPRLPEPSGP